METIITFLIIGVVVLLSVSMNLLDKNIKLKKQKSSLFIKYTEVSEEKYKLKSTLMTKNIEMDNLLDENVRLLIMYYNNTLKPLQTKEHMLNQIPNLKEQSYEQQSK